MRATARIRPWWTVGVTALSYLLASVLASVVANPAHPTALAATPQLLSVLAGVLGAVTIGPLAARLHLPLGQRLVALFLLAYLLSTLTNEVEAQVHDPGSDLDACFGSGTEPVAVDVLDLDDRVERLGGGVVQAELTRLDRWPAVDLGRCG